MKKILYLTDLSYQAKGRNYCEEDIYITDKLKERFDVALCHPRSAESFEDAAQLIIFRNTGSVMGYEDTYRAFVQRVRQKGLHTFNSFDGKADMQGKQYLLDLTRAGYPVIPSVERACDMHLLPQAAKYVLKPKNGADSIGLEFLDEAEIRARDIVPGTVLIQPCIEFLYEVSFYFIGDTFEYALYAPDKEKRWALERYPHTAQDIAFARRFIEWNSLSAGIQRVDACKTADGKLLLVELEDLNPYLSLLETDAATREKFLVDFIAAIEKAAR